MTTSPEIDVRREDTPTKPFIVEPTGEHLHTIILLHGRGSTGSEFASELFESQDSGGRTLPELLPACKWVFPSAPSIFSITFQEHISQWYDVSSLTDPDMQFEDQLDDMRESILSLRNIIRHEQIAVHAGRITLGGISQGFSLAAILALVDPSHLSALVGFASWLPLDSIRKAAVGSDSNGNHVMKRAHVSCHLAERLGLDKAHAVWNENIPIFVAHCADDTVVNIELGRNLWQVFSNLGYQVRWLETPTGGHWVNEPHALDELVTFLRQSMPADLEK